MKKYEALKAISTAQNVKNTQAAYEADAFIAAADLVFDDAARRWLLTLGDQNVPAQVASRVISY